MRCGHCGREFESKTTGHPARYCSGACRQAAYRGRKAAETSPVARDAPLDAHEALARLAARLEAAHEAAPGNASLARVLKDVLLALPAAAEPGDDDPLAELRALANSVS